MASQQTAMRRAGMAVVAWCLVAWCVGFFVSGRFDCNLILACFLGFAIRNGSRSATWVMLGISLLGGVAVVAILVSVIVHGLWEVGLGPLFGTLVGGGWALVNCALLSRALAWPTATAEGEVCPPKFQFRLRTLLLAAVLVALGSWLGSRPLEADCGWEIATSYSSQGKSGLWSVGVVGYRCGTPAAGYLWRSEWPGEGPSRVRCASSGRGWDLLVDGEVITPTQEFQLFVNDAEDKPMRLVLSREEAREVFGEPLKLDRIERFWNEVVEPARAQR